MPKQGVVNVNLDDHAHDIQALLINPNWKVPSRNGVPSKKGKEGVTIEDFRKLRISERLMKDGIVFIWNEKELMSPIIKFFEEQGMNYIENVCWVMLDESKREGRLIVFN